MTDESSAKNAEEGNAARTAEAPGSNGTEKATGNCISAQGLGPFWTSLGMN